MSVQVDTNTRYNWRMQNYVFDVAAGKYVLQQRCNVAAMDSLTHSVRSMKQYQYVTSEHGNDDGGKTSSHSANIAPQRIQPANGESRCVQRVRRNQSNSKLHKKKKNWLQTKHKVGRPVSGNQSDREHDTVHTVPLNVTIPANTGCVILSQYHVSLIVSNWYRVYYQRSRSLRSLRFRSRLRVNAFIISALKSYTVQRFEFDEQHPLVQTWINYNIPMDEDVPTPHRLTSTEEEDDDDDEHEHEESLSVSQDSFSLPTNSVSYSLFSQTSVSSGLHSRSNSAASSKKTRSQQQQQQQQQLSKTASKAMKHHNNWECTACLGSIKWSTIFLGNVLHSQLMSDQVYVCNVSVDKLGYGLGIAFCGSRGHRNSNGTLYDQSKLSKLIQDRYNGYADTMKDCFVLYDDGEFCDWDMQLDSNKSNVNQPHRSDDRVRLISKLSRYALKTSKAKQLSLSPASSLSDDREKSEINERSAGNKRQSARSKSKKDFFANARRRKQKRAAALKAEKDEFEQKPDREPMAKCTSSTIRKRDMYGNNKRSKMAKSRKKMNEKFGFDENDVIQIAVDLRHGRITIHNINNHKCVVLSGFDYDCIRIAFVLRFSTITVLDQKWL